MTDPFSQPADPTISESAPSPARLAHWVRDYAEDLQRFLASRQVIESDIKDVCQEVYLRLLRFERVEEIRNPAAYLFRIAANVAHDFRLRQAGWTPLDDQMLDNLQSELTAEELADAAARHHTLFNAIDALPPVPRAALVLQAREGMSHQEIAERLGISQRAVRKAITRGHELLRVALARDF